MRLERVKIQTGRRRAVAARADRVPLDNDYGSTGEAGRAQWVRADQGAGGAGLFALLMDEIDAL